MPWVTASSGLGVERQPLEPSGDKELSEWGTCLS